MITSDHVRTIESLEHYAMAEGVAPERRRAALDNFTARRIRIDHPGFARCIRKIATLHRRSQFNQYGGGLLITGISGTGKSSVLRHYQDHFERSDTQDGQVIPVLSVQTPSSPTVKNLAEAILRALGDPASSRGTSESKTERIYKFFSACHVELLLIDEFHHFLEGSRARRSGHVTDWLKNLINVTNVGVVLAGLPSCEEALHSNQQLARRFSARLRLEPFGYETEESQLEFRGVLAGFQNELPIRTVDLHEDKTARRLFVATNGIIDYVIKLLEEACDIARVTGATSLDQRIFALAFQEAVWADSPPELNPFSSPQVLRPLTQPGEPFANAQQVKVRADTRRPGRSVAKA